MLSVNKVQSHNYNPSFQAKFNKSALKVYEHSIKNVNSQPLFNAISETTHAIQNKMPEMEIIGGFLDKNKKTAIFSLPKNNITFKPENPKTFLHALKSILKDLQAREASILNK